MKAIVLSVGLLFSASLAYSEIPKVFYGPALISDIPFELVSCSGFLMDCSNGQIVFDGVRLETKTKNPLWAATWILDVRVESVKVVLLKDVKSPITLLDVININSFMESPIAHAKKVIIKVTSETDYKLWTKFLADVKKKCDRELAERTQGKRVLPPQVK